jgi:hypothetical protein
MNPVHKPIPQHRHQSNTHAQWLAHAALPQPRLPKTRQMSTKHSNPKHWHRRTAVKSDHASEKSSELLNDLGLPKSHRVGGKVVSPHQVHKPGNFAPAVPQHHAFRTEASHHQPPHQAARIPRSRVNCEYSTVNPHSGHAHFAGIKSTFRTDTGRDKDLVILQVWTGLNHRFTLFPFRSRSTSLAI